jgi:hypothetical protein
MRVLGALLFCALAGCAVLDPVPRLAVTADRILGEAVSLSRSTPAEQKAGLVHAQEQFRRDPSAYNQARLATLLATLPAPLRDEARALELLEPLIESDASGPGRLAAFLAPHLGERQRLARELDRAAKERTGLLAAERERIAADKERDKREEALRQQLEALRAIERGILEREERARQKSGTRP